MEESRYVMDPKVNKGRVRRGENQRKDLYFKGQPVVKLLLERGVNSYHFTESAEGGLEVFLALLVVLNVGELREAPASSDVLFVQAEPS